MIHPSINQSIDAVTLSCNFLFDSIYPCLLTQPQPLHFLLTSLSTSLHLPLTTSPSPHHLTLLLTTPLSPPYLILSSPPHSLLTTPLSSPPHFLLTIPLSSHHITFFLTTSHSLLTTSLSHHHITFSSPPRASPNWSRSRATLARQAAHPPCGQRHPISTACLTVRGQLSTLEWLLVA